MLVGILGMVLGLTTALAGLYSMRRKKGAPARWFEPCILPLMIVVVVACSVIFAAVR
jgi:Mg2+ and Co2+ transporter CorA